MASSNIGNTGASALLRSASSIANAQADYQDKLAALQWSNSAHTDADWEQYSSYLNGRIDKLQGTGSLSNASKALSLTSTLQTAQKAFVSSTIQRSSIDILEGNGTLQDKANAVASFYQMATNNGDDGLAQSLREQFDSIDQQIQYQAQQQQQLASDMAAKQVTSVNAYIDTLKQDLTTLSGQIGQYSVGKLDQLGKEYASAIKDSGVNINLPKNPSIYDVYNGVVNNMVTSLQVAGNALGPVDGASLLNEANKIISGQTKFDFAGQQIGYNDIQNAVAAAAAGQNYFSFVERNGETKAVANNEQSVVWAKDPTTGQFSLIPTYQNNGLQTNYGQTGLVLDKNGNVAQSTKTTDKQLGYQDLLKRAGFDVTNEGGQIVINGNAQTAQMLKDAGFDPNSFSTNLVAGPNGQLRFEYTDNNGATKLYGLTFDKSGKLNSPFEINPLADTMPGFAVSLGSVNGLINSAQLKQTQAQQIAQLQAQPLKPVAQLSMPQTQSAPVQPVAPIVPQSAPTIKVVQPAASITAVQNTAPSPQHTVGPNLNQSGQSTGITLKQPVLKTIPL